MARGYIYLRLFRSKIFLILSFTLIFRYKLSILEGGDKFLPPVGGGIWAWGEENLADDAFKF